MSCGVGCHALLVLQKLCCVLRAPAAACHAAPGHEVLSAGVPVEVADIEELVGSACR
jgi:hypothetical protein